MATNTDNLAVNSDKLRQSNSQDNGNKDISSNDQSLTNQPESENTEGGPSTAASAELQRSGNPASNPLLSDKVPESSSNDPNHREVSATLEEDPDDGSQQDLEEPVDDHQVSNESHDSSSAKLEHDHLQNPKSQTTVDQNSSHDQSPASFASQLGKLCGKHICIYHC